MKANRSTLIGAGIGLFLGMPLFEASLLVMLAIDGEWFNAAYTIHYFTESSNVILLLVVFHAVTASIGALVGALSYLSKQRRKLRVVAGGRQA